MCMEFVKTELRKDKQKLISAFVYEKESDLNNINDDRPKFKMDEF